MEEEREEKKQRIKCRGDKEKEKEAADLRDKTAIKCENVWEHKKKKITKNKDENKITFARGKTM